MTATLLAARSLVRTTNQEAFMLTRCHTLALLAISLLLPAASGAQAPEGALSLETYLDWEWVSGPQISPDGSQIVYTRSWVDKMKDRQRSSVWIMNADGSRNRFLVDGSAPTWSPDGSRIAFTDEGDTGDAQIFVRWMDAEAATTQITRVDHSPGTSGGRRTEPSSPSR